MAAGGKPPGYRWLVFLVLATGYLLVYFHRLCPAVVAVDMMTDLKAGAGLMGLLASAYFYPYALMQIPSGILSDTWGPRKTITSFFVLAGFASMLFGLAPSATWAVVARVLVGLGVALLFVPTLKIMTRWFRTNEFATMMGLLVATGGLGVLSAAMPLALLSGILGWRGSFVLVGALTLAMAAAIWILVRDTPEEKGFPPIEGAAASAGRKGPAIGTWQGLWMVARSPRFWPVALWFFFSSGIFLSFAGLWAGPYFIDVYGLSRLETGAILSMVAVAKIAGCPAISFISDRLRRRKAILVFATVVLIALVVPLAYFPAAMSVPMLYVWTLAFALCSSAVVVVAFTTGKESFPLEITGTAVGLINVFPFLGGAVMQPVLGLVLETFERSESGYSAAAYGTAFQIYFYSALVALGAALLIKETLPRPENLHQDASDGP